MMDNTTPSLFDDLECGGSGNPKRTSLTIAAGRNNTLSKNQRAFNRLTKRIEQIQKTIQTETAKLEAILAAYLADMPRLKRSLADKQLTLAKALGNTTKMMSYGKRQLEKVRAAICDLCDRAFSEAEPDEETERFYNAWSGSNYQEELQNQRDRVKRMIAEEARHAFGMEINVDDIDDTPEGFARFMNRLKNDLMNGDRKPEDRFAKRKKTRKQIEREEAQRQEEALKLKSLRAIYLSLAKALHPDTITDPAEKARKEDLMKRVTAAYAEKDLSTLLKLELEWVSSEHNALDALSEEKLKLYVMSLKEQVAALEEELAMVYHHPRFACVSGFARYPEAYARQQIRAMANDFRKALKGFEEAVRMAERPAPKQEILRFVDEYMAMVNFSQPFSQDFAIDF